MAKVNIILMTDRIQKELVNVETTNWMKQENCYVQNIMIELFILYKLIIFLFMCEHSYCINMNYEINLVNLARTDELSEANQDR